MTEEDEAFNEIERRAQQRKEAVKVALNTKEELVKLIFDSYNQGVNDALEVGRAATIEEVAQHVEKMTVFGKDTVDSFAIYIRSLK